MSRALIPLDGRLKRNTEKDRGIWKEIQVWFKGRFKLGNEYLDEKVENVRSETNLNDSQARLNNSQALVNLAVTYKTLAEAKEIERAFDSHSANNISEKQGNIAELMKSIAEDIQVLKVVHFGEVTLIDSAEGNEGKRNEASGYST